MCVYCHLCLGGASTLAPPGSGNDSLKLSGPGIDRHYLRLVGPSPLCRWVCNRLAFDKKDSKARQGLEQKERPLYSLTFADLISSLGLGSVKGIISPLDEQLLFFFFFKAGYP